MTQRAWYYARQLVDALGERFASSTSWRRAPRSCPPWCTWRCTASWRSGGEHRSDPVTLVDDAGNVLVVTAVQATSGRRAIEVRLRVVEHQAAEVDHDLMRGIGQAS